MNSLRVLLAERDRATRELLHAFLLRAGHAVFVAASAREAIEAFRRDGPDAVLLEAAMPDTGGIDAVRAMRDLSGSRWVPLILLAAHTDDDEVRHGALTVGRGERTGADWTLTKPCSFAVLQARLDSVHSIVALRHELEHKNRALEAFEERARQEIRTARQTLRSFNRIEAAYTGILQHWIVPAIEFSGDTISAAHSPDGSFWAMLADNIGHGLSAALNAIPLTRAFRAVAAKGLNPATMVRELNRTARARQPHERFVAATIARISGRDGIIEVWNGGNPEALLIDAEGAVADVFDSRHLPLGTVSDDELDTHFKSTPLVPGLQLAVVSDGLLETGGARAFGRAGLFSALSAVPPGKRFGSVVSRMQEIISGLPNPDDVSFALVDCDAAAVLHAFETADAPRAPGLGRNAGGEPWRLSATFCEAQIRRLDLVPFIKVLIDQIDPPRLESQALFLVLSELITNAIDHGLLGMDSRLKQGADGYDAYMDERARRLEDLSGAELHIDLTRGAAPGEPLHIRISDSGGGFDFTRILRAAPAGAEDPYGRGISLVRSMVRSLEYCDGGKTVEVCCERI